MTLCDWPRQDFRLEHALSVAAGPLRAQSLWAYRSDPAMVAVWPLIMRGMDRWVMPELCPILPATLLRRMDSVHGDAKDSIM